MNRNAIHFAIGYNNENHVISGMGLKSEIFIEINLQYAFFNNFEFYISKNRVILTPGDKNGFLPVKFIKKVTDNKKNILYFNKYQIIIKYIQKLFCVIINKKLVFKSNDPNQIGDFMNKNNLFKYKIITVIEKKEDEKEYIDLIKNGIENKKINYVSLFVDYLIDNKKNENGEDNVYSSKYVKKVGVDWVKFYDTIIYKNEDEDNKIESQKEENDNMKIKENSKNINNNIINFNINDSSVDNNNIYHEKLTKEIIFNKLKLKYYILIFLNYTNNEKSTIKSIDVIIFKSSEIKENKLLHSFRFIFNQLEKAEKKYTKFLNELKKNLNQLDIVHKRIVVCISRNDQSFINKEFAISSLKIPKLFIRNIIIINENDFKGFYELDEEDNNLSGEDLSDWYLEAKNIFYNNYLANEEQIKSLIII